MKTSKHAVRNNPLFPFLSIIAAAALVSALISVSDARAGSRLKETKESTSPIDAVTSSDIEQLPGNQRNLQDIINMTPGMVDASVSIRIR